MAQAIRVVHLCDDDDSAKAVRELLSGSAASTFDTSRAHDVAGACEMLARDGADVVLLDLAVGCDLGCFARLWAGADAPVVLLADTDSHPLALRMLRAGAADLLDRTHLHPTLLARTLVHAIETQRARGVEEGERRREEASGRELTRLAEAPGTRISARHFGASRLREAAPQAFDEFVERYSDLLDGALEARLYKTEHETGRQLRQLARDLGFMSAGPRDVVEVHAEALELKTRALPVARASAYADEARWMTLELMGDLVTVYRSQMTRHGAPRDDADGGGS